MKSCCQLDSHVLTPLTRLASCNLLRQFLTVVKFRFDGLIRLTCMYLEVGPQVAGITKSLATEITLVGLHTHVTHKVDMKFGRRDKSLGAHWALPLPFFAVAWPMAAAVALAMKMVMDVAGKVSFELCIGIALLATVTEVHIWVFRNTFKKKITQCLLVLKF